MHKDPNLRKRNALVIPGGLLAVLAVVGMVHVSVLRNDTGTCEDPGLIVLAGACRSAMLALAIPLVIGLALVGSGAIGFRNKATCRQGWGSWAHFGLAFLIALVLLPALGILVGPSLVGSGAAVTRGGVDYPITSIFAGLTVVGVVALVPFLGLFVGRYQSNRCCHEKGCFEPCFCDEPIAAEGPAAEPPIEVPAEGAAPWPVTAPGDQPAPPEPEPVEEAPLAPEAPAGEAWEVVPDEEPAGNPEPAPTPPRKAAAAAPALAQRPTDPAAPPQDAMAVAAKWAEEDEEAARELPIKGKREAKAAKAAKKKTKRPVKKAAPAAKGPRASKKR